MISDWEPERENLSNHDAIRCKSKESDIEADAKRRDDVTLAISSVRGSIKLVTICSEQTCPHVTRHSVDHLHVFIKISQLLVQ